jgi:HSP20 family protein
MNILRVCKGIVPHMQSMDEENLAYTPAREGTVLAANCYEAIDGYIAQFSLPGVDPDRVQVTVQGDTVIRKGERTNQTFENAQQIWNGVGQGHFEQAFSFPKPVDAQEAQAPYEWGMLTLRLAKARHARAHTVKVHAGSSREPTMPEQAATPGRYASATRGSRAAALRGPFGGHRTARGGPCRSHAEPRGKAATDTCSHAHCHRRQTLGQGTRLLAPQSAQPQALCLSILTSTNVGRTPSPPLRKPKRMVRDVVPFVSRTG